MRKKLMSLGLPVLAQILASASSLIISIAAARGLTVSSFGQVAIRFAVYSIVLGVVRAFTSEILVYKYSAVNNGELIGAAGASTSAVGMLSLVLALACLALGLTPGMDWQICLTMATAILPLFIREHIRVILTIQNRGGVALNLEAVFIALLIPAMHPLFSSSLANILLVWSVAAWATAIIGFISSGISLSVIGGLYWARTERREGSVYAGDFLVTNGMNQGTVFAVAAIGTVAASAAIRSVQVLLTPILLVTRGLLVAIGPQARRAAVAKNWSLLWKLSLGYAVSVAGMCMLSLLVVSHVPESWVRVLLGDSTRLALDIFLPAALAVSALGVASGAAFGLRALGEVKTTFMWKMISAPVSLVAVVFGTTVGGASGSQLGLAAGELVRGSANWLLFRRSMNFHRQISGFSEDR